MEGELKMISVYKNDVPQYIMYVHENDEITLMLRELVAEMDNEDYDEENYSWKFVENY